MVKLCSLAVERALGGIGRWRCQDAAHVLQRQPARLQLGGIDLDADRRLLLAADDDLGDACDLRNLLGHDLIGEIVDRGQRQRIGMRRQDQDRQNPPG